MKHKKIIICLILLLVMTLSILLVGCENNKEKSLNLKLVSQNELDNNIIETKTNNSMIFVENNNSLLKINVKENISPSLYRSVEMLRDVVKNMSGTTLEIVVNGASNGIFVGELSNITLDGVKNDGFKISISDNRIDIKGNDDGATRNGVYHFIEQYLGVIFLTSTENYIPKHNNIYLNKGEIISNPNTIWRDVYSYEMATNDFSARLKLNSIDTDITDEKIIAKMSDEERASFDKLTDNEKRVKLNERRQYTGWGTWCHSYYRFLSPDEYFDTHPEYFSLIGKERTHFYKGIDAHLCLSNPEVYNIVENNLDEMIEKNPNVKYWDFSANDNYHTKHGCECENCRRMDKEAGGTGMGTLLPFINKLARHVKEKYPDREIYISTLAYTFNLKPPKNIIAEDNVVIKLCAMPGDQASSYLDPKNGNTKRFHDELLSWSKIAKKIVVWDYVVDFAHLLLPFPNLHIQEENQKFYIDNNVEGIFHQASREKGGELSNLRGWYLSQLMWKGQDIDSNKEISRYISAYFGKAAPKIIEYLNTLHDNMLNNTSSLGLYDQSYVHANGYLSNENIHTYETLIRSSKELVKGDEKYTRRVEEIELNIEYAKMLLTDIEDKERNMAKEKVTMLAERQDIIMTQEWQDIDTFMDSIDTTIKEHKKILDKPKNIVVISLISVTIVLIVVSLILNAKSKKKINNV